MTATSMLHVRVDEETKDQATTALKAMGLTLSEAVRLFLRRVAAEQALPFTIKIPNAVTQAALEEARHISQHRHADAKKLFDDLAAQGKQP